MMISFAVVIVLSVVTVGGALTLAAFGWAIRTKQFSVEQLTNGASVVFDEAEPEGIPQDMIFRGKHGHAAPRSS